MRRSCICITPACCGRRGPFCYRLPIPLCPSAIACPREEPARTTSNSSLLALLPSMGFRGASPRCQGTCVRVEVLRRAPAPTVHALSPACVDPSLYGILYVIPVTYTAPPRQ